MTAADEDRYLAHFRAVLDFIDLHLDEPLSLDRLCRVAAFSKFHFHRQFAALFGLGVYEYVQLLRLKRAAFQLAFRSSTPIIEVALSSGYESAGAFSRAFKKHLGQTPSAFRKQPRWDVFRARSEPLGQLRALQRKPALPAPEVRIVDFPETKVARLEHRGDHAQIGATIRAFIAWRRANGLPPRTSATFNLFHDDPDAIAPEDHRFSLCAATSRPVKPNAQGVVASSIPGGRCAVLRHVGPDDTLPATVRQLYASWLPQSGEELRAFPLFLQRVSFFPDVPEHQAITDVFLPLR